MSHTSIAHTRDYIHVADKGDLTNPQQTAGFVVDPLLTPISTSSQPHLMHPDPTPSTDPALFDASTRHPNSHYDHSKILSKKKRVKKLGTGAVPSHTGSVHTGGRSFAEHDKAAHERAERRDHDLAQAAEDEDGDEYEDEEEEDQAAISHNSHHENRITGSEQQRGGSAPADAKPNPSGASQTGAEAGVAKGGDDAAPEGGATTMKEKVSGVLASAQEKASGMMEAVKSAPVVSSLLSKVGLGGAKAEDDSTKDQNAQAKKEEEEA